MQLDANSLAKTVDAVQEAFFFKHPVSSTDREAAAFWIATRQGQPGCYADMFAPTPADAANGIHLFTGERVAPSASLRHVSGEEACRAMILLKPKSKEARSALERATTGMLLALERSRGNGRDFFCCGTCDPALWRHIAAGGLRGAEEWIPKGLKNLKAHRDSLGRWRRFPFYFTLLALTEIDLPEARREIKYAAAVIEKSLARRASAGKYSQRRRAVLETALSLI